MVGRKEAVADEAKTDALICKRCVRKSKRQETTRYLPQEMIFQCLFHLPAHFLHDVVRHVCREWSLIIRSRDFARHHLRNSTGGGLLIQPWSTPRKGLYSEMRRGRLETCKFECGFNGFIWTSCNGLVVISNKHSKDNYVANPLTKQLTILPPFYGHYRCCGLAFAEPSMVYKVVRACGYNSAVPKTQITVLTIGVDEVWRHINITNLLPSPEERNFSNLPVVTGGYVHWPTKEFVLTLDVETEIVHRFSVPPGLTVGVSFLPMGRNLSLVSASPKFYMDVWEMDSVTGEWTMLCRIKKRALNARFKGMYTNREKSATAWCWLAAREVVVFALRYCQSIWVAYHVKTGEIQVFELEAEGFRASFHFSAHVNSLVWWE